MKLCPSHSFSLLPQSSLPPSTFRCSPLPLPTSFCPPCLLFSVSFFPPHRKSLFVWVVAPPPFFHSSLSLLRPDPFTYGTSSRLPSHKLILVVCLLASCDHWVALILRLGGLVFFCRFLSRGLFFCFFVFFCFFSLGLIFGMVIRACVGAAVSLSKR